MQQSTNTRRRGRGLHPDAGELSRLADLDKLINNAIEWRDHAIAEAREAGATWAQVCKAANLSTPAAMKYERRAAQEVTA